MTAKECEYCEYTCAREPKMRTHYLLKHPEGLEETDRFDAELTEGEASTEVRAEKGEVFGYE